MQKTQAHNGHSKSLNFLPFDLSDRLNDTRERLSDLGDQASEFIRRRPAAALLGALCMGFVLSRVVNRR